MAQTKEGARLAAARRCGLRVDDYMAKVANGEKWCWRCRDWRPVDLYTRDKSRHDGLKTTCAHCQPPVARAGPSIPERRRRRIACEGWCRDCRTWLPLATIHAGLCRMHTSQRDRERYATNAVYRAERRQHSHARQRGVDKVPPEGQYVLMDKFEGLCAYCNSAPATTWDHIVPITKGGTTVPWNILPACATCNSSKGNRELEDWASKRGILLEQYVFDQMDLENCL